MVTINYKHWSRALALVNGLLVCRKPNERRRFKVFRYSFSEAIQIFSIPLKVILSLSNRYEIFTINWLWIEVYQNAVLSKIDITMTRINKKLWNRLKTNFARSRPAKLFRSKFDKHPVITHSYFLKFVLESSKQWNHNSLSNIWL